LKKIGGDDHAQVAGRGPRSETGLRFVANAAHLEAEQRVVEREAGAFRKSFGRGQLVDLRPHATGLVDPAQHGPRLHVMRGQVEPQPRGGVPVRAPPAGADLGEHLEVRAGVAAEPLLDAA